LWASPSARDLYMTMKFRPLYLMSRKSKLASAAGKPPRLEFVPSRKIGLG
jgi:hypothetical protein